MDGFASKLITGLHRKGNLAGEGLSHPLGPCPGEAGRWQLSWELVNKDPKSIPVPLQCAGKCIGYQ